MIYPINHPYYAVSDTMLEVHRQELQRMIDKRHPAIWKLAR